MTKDFSAYDDIDLVKYVAFAPQSSLAWQRAFTEFDRRYNRFIGTVVYRKCNQLGYSRGHSYLEDFIQDVYKKLLQNDREGLKRFNGEHKNQLLRYLQTTSFRIVLNKHYRDEIAPTHSPSGGLQTLDQIMENLSDGSEMDLKAVLPDPHGMDDTKKSEILDELKHCLDSTQKNNKHKERNILIFMLHLFAGFSADEVASRFDMDVSSKRISNLVTDMKKMVVRCLQKRL